MSDEVIASLAAAVQASPDDVVLRLHLAELLVAASRREEALPHVVAALSDDPASVKARALMTAILAGGAADRADRIAVAGPDPGRLTAAVPDPPPAQRADVDGRPDDEFDWHSAESEVSELAPPMFVHGGDEAGSSSGPAFSIEAAGVTLADVGGLDEVKKRLEAAFLAPMRNPELRKLYGKSLRGGLLLYGPPGCGKTFVARAVAGELGAGFLAVSLADVLDMYVGESEKNVHEMFEQARASAPCVLFLDEVDALGMKRTLTRNTATRGAVNQLLSEFDGVAGQNEGVYVLAATNHPWDVDAALLRPGRLDRRLLVLPPDRPAREAILRYHLKERPIGGIDVGRLAKATDGYSGADLAHLCETAAESALLDSIRTGTARLIGMADLEEALTQVRSSVGPWLEVARNVALYANASGEYDELAAYLRKARRF